MKNWVYLFIFLAASFTSEAAQDSAYEDRLLQSITFLQQGNHAQAINHSRDLVADYPKSKLAQMLYADLLLAKIAPLNSVGLGLNSEASQQEFLLELQQRLSRQQSPALQGFIPENLLFLAERHSHAIVVDLENSRIFVYKNEHGKPVLQTDYFTTIGLKGGGKLIEGDQKTPVGVYHVTHFIDDKKLPDLYGNGAFPINYPNVWDRRHKRTGYGIWIHGTPSHTYNRAPLASNGCIVVSNPDFDAIDSFVQPNAQTPVLVADQINWLSPEAWQQQRDQMRQVLNDWITDWESLDFERYQAHYSPSDFLPQGRDFSNWVERKRRVFRGKTFTDVDYSNLNIFRYPGEQDLVLMQFDQVYKSNNFNVALPKQIYWSKTQSAENTDWKIVYEKRRKIKREKVEQTSN